MNLIQELTKKELITPPTWLPENVMYLTLMGSVAYGVSGGDSDRDVYGFCIPRKDIVFPHLAGEILGFGKEKERFWQYQQHHIRDETALGGKGVEYDITVYSIVKFFQLAMGNNPNMVDALFTPERCVLTRTQVWQTIKRKRDIFLHRGCFHKFKGYAYSQLHKMKPKYDKDGNRILPDGKRKELVLEFGYDVKFAYHLVRLLLECEQILTEGTLDLERHSEQLKAIRRGEWDYEYVKEWFDDKEKSLESLYEKSELPYGPREEEIKDLLLQCLEMHYGTLDNVVVSPGRQRRALEEISRIANNALF